MNAIEIIAFLVLCGVICILCFLVGKLWDRSYSLEEALRKLDPTLYI